MGGIDVALDPTVVERAKAAIARGRDEVVTLDTFGVNLFIDVLLPPPTLIMVGGVHIAITLATLAKTLNYRTIVIDRPGQAEATRSSAATAMWRAPRRPKTEAGAIVEPGPG